MKGKIFSILTSAAMVASLATPLHVNAQQGPANGVSGTISAEQFSNLNGQCYLTGNTIVTARNGLDVNLKKDMELDLGGYSLTLEGNYNVIEAPVKFTNGTIVLGEEATSNQQAFFHVCQTSVTLDNVTLTGEDYYSNFGVFHLDDQGTGKTSTLNIVNNSNVNLTNDKDLVANQSGVIKGQSPNVSKVTIKDSTMTLNKAHYGFISADFEIINSTVKMDNGNIQNDDYNGVNDAVVSLNNSTLELKGFKDRGFTFRNSNNKLTLKNNSKLIAKDNGNADFKVHKNAGDMKEHIVMDELSSIEAKNIVLDGTNKTFKELFKLNEGYTIKNTNNVYKVAEKTKFDYVSAKYFALGDESSKLNYKLSPENADDPVTYKSNNTKIATVDKDGYVTPVSKGKTTVTITVGTGDEAITKDASIVVYEVTSDIKDKDTIEQFKALVRKISFNYGMLGHDDYVSDEDAKKICDAMDDAKTINFSVLKDKISKDSLTDKQLTAVNDLLGNGKVGAYYDLNLQFNIEGQKPGRASMTSYYIDVDLDVPQELIKEGRTFSVITLSGDKATKMNTTYKNGKVTFKTYAYDKIVLTYTDKAVDVVVKVDDNKTTVSNSVPETKKEEAKQIASTIKVEDKKMQEVAKEVAKKYENDTTLIEKAREALNVEEWDYNEVNIEVKSQLVTEVKGLDTSSDAILTLDIKLLCNVVASIDKNGTVESAVLASETVENPGEITISFEVSDEIKAKLEEQLTAGNKLYIKHIKENGDVYYHEATLEGNTVTFVNANGFSDFILMYGSKVPANQVKGQPTVTPTDTTTKEDKKSDKVKTGDNTNTMLYVELAAMALVGCAILYIQNKKSSLLNK